MHVFMNNRYKKEKLQYDIYICGIKENVQQLSRTDRRNSLFSDKCMDALTRKTPVMLSLWTEVTELNNSVTQELTLKWDIGGQTTIAGHGNGV